LPAPTAAPAPPPAGRPLAESLLLSTVRISTFLGRQSLTAATGFFFERGPRLFLVTSRHVVIDEAVDHLPDRIEITVHTDTVNLTRTVTLSILLYRDGKADWRQGRDSGGEIDVAVLEIDRSALPASALLYCYGPGNLPPEPAAVGRPPPLLPAAAPRRGSPADPAQAGSETRAPRAGRDRSPGSAVGSSPTRPRSRGRPPR